MRMPERPLYPHRHTRGDPEFTHIGLNRTDDLQFKVYRQIKLQESDFSTVLREH